MENQAAKAQEFHQLREQAEQEANSGRLERAHRICEERVAWAGLHGDDRLADEAFCGLAAVRIALDAGDTVANQLRKLLMSSSDQTVQMLAAYGLSQHHHLAGDESKSTFYARCALDHGRAGQDPRHIIRCLNALAVSRSVHSEFAAATSLLREALDIVDGGALEKTEPMTEWIRYVMKSNLGCNLVLLGRPRDGLDLFFEAKDHLANQVVQSEEMDRQLNLSIAFGYLYVDQPLDAYRHAFKSLSEAPEEKPSELRKKALFLLGEAAKLAGVETRAHHWYRCLQQDFYPDMPDVTEFLLHTETRELVNPWV